MDVKMPDGTIIRNVPEGTTRSQLQARLDKAKAPPVAIQDLPEPQSAGKRFAMGLAEPVVGLAQLSARGLSGIGAGIKAAAGETRVSNFLQALPGRNDAAAAELTKAQELGAPEGFDLARLAGNVVTLAPTALAGGVPASMAGIARAGAVAGGVGGAAMPTAGGEGYGARKAAQTAIGAGAGAAMGPIAQKGLEGLGMAGSAIASRVRSSIGPSATPQQIQITINQTLQQAGIDPAAVPQAFLDDVTNQVRQAMQSGGTVDTQALANRATLETVGIPGTRGQITQDPAQYGKELFLREAPGGEDLAAQYKNAIQTLNQRLGEVQAGAAPPLRPVEAGQQAMDVLQQADNRGNALVGALYGVARGTAGLDTPINGAGMAQNIVNRMEQAMVGDKLPSSFTTVLNQLSTGARELDIRTGEQITRAINARLGQTSDGVERAALNIFKTELQDAIHSVGSAQGQQAAQAFRTAKNAYAQRAQIHEAVPALKAVVDGEIAPDDFMRKFVYGAKQAELRQLGGFVRQASPQTWQQIRGQVIGDLQLAANPSGQAQDFSQAAFNKTLRSLDQSGKLEVLFTKAEIQKLQAIGRAGELIQKGPPGVSRTGLSGAAKAAGMLSRMVGAIPGLGRMGGVAQAAAAKGGNVMQATASMQAPSVAHIPLRNAIPQALTNRLAPLAGPAVTALDFSADDPRATARVVSAY